MRWYSREFLRRLRGRVRREVETQPEWRKTARRIRRQKRLHPLGTAFGVVIRSVFPWLIIYVTIRTETLSDEWGRVGVPVLWTLFMSWVLMVSLAYVSQLLGLLGGGFGVRTLAQYPVDSLQVWDAMVARVFRGSWWLIYEALVVVWFACREAHAPPAVWLAGVVGAMTVWISALALAVVLYARRWPPLVYVYAYLLLFGGGAFSAIILLRVGILEPAMVLQIHEILAWVTPPGWACQLAEWLTRARPDFPFVAMGLLAALVGYAIPCYRAIRERYTFWQIDDPATATGDEEPSPKTVAPVPDMSRVHEIEQRVKQGEFLKARVLRHPDWLARLTIPSSPRPAAIVDFLTGGRANWGKFQACTLVLMILLTPLLWNAAPETVGLTMVVMFVAGLLFLAVRLNSPIPVSRQVRSVSPFALLPIGSKEMRQVIVRVNAVRLVVALPCWLLAGVWMALAAAEAPLFGLRIGFLTWLAVLLLQPVLAALRYSREIKIRFFAALGLLFLILLPITAAEGVGAALITRASWGWQIAAEVVLGLVSCGAAALYQHYFAPRFDLLLRLGPQRLREMPERSWKVSVGGWR